MVAWDNWLWRALDKFIEQAPELLKDKLGLNVDEIGFKWLERSVVAGGLVLRVGFNVSEGVNMEGVQVLEEKGFKEGTIKWKERVSTTKQEEEPEVHH